MNKKDVNRIKCPYCGSRNTASFLYGMPAYDEDLVTDEEEERIILGGCCISTVNVEGKIVQMDPRYFCNDCEGKFGKPPLYKDNNEYRDIRDHISRIKFTYDGYFVGSDVLDIRNEKTGIVVRMTSLLRHIDEEYKISQEKWNDFISKMYDEFFVNEWSHNYENHNHLVMDGTYWTLEIVLDGGKKQVYKGSNAYPWYWDEFAALMKEYGMKSLEEVETDYPEDENDEITGEKL